MTALSRPSTTRRFAGIRSECTQTGGPSHAGVCSATSQAAVTASVSTESTLRSSSIAIRVAESWVVSGPPR